MVLGYAFLVFASLVAVDLFIRICVYSKTKSYKVKHQHFWWIR